MNKTRRKAIDGFVKELEDIKGQINGDSSADMGVQALKSAIEDLKSNIEQEKDDEQEYYDNMPESLQNGDKGQAASEAVDELDNAATKLGEIIDVLDSFESDIDEAITNLANAKGE